MWRLDEEGNPLTEVSEAGVLRLMLDHTAVSADGLMLLLQNGET